MQATRGTPLTDAPVAGTAPQRHRRLLIGLLLVATLVAVVDQVTKQVLISTRAGRPPLHLIDRVLDLEVTRNPGAAFSIAAGATVLFSLVAVAVIVVIVRSARRLRSPAWAISLGLVLGGAVGNLIDRVFRSPGPLRGWVVDWIHLAHWPVFNLADSAIVVGAALAIVLSARGVPMRGAPADTARDRS